MTPSEFRAWFEGFSENIAVQPTPQQWTRIKAKIAELAKPELSFRFSGKPVVSAVAEDEILTNKTILPPNFQGDADLAAAHPGCRTKFEQGGTTTLPITLDPNGWPRAPMMDGDFGAMMHNHGQSK